MAFSEVVPTPVGWRASTAVGAMQEPIPDLRLNLIPWEPNKKFGLNPSFNFIYFLMMTYLLGF